MMQHKLEMILKFSDVLACRVSIFCGLAEAIRTDFSEDMIHDFRVSTRRLLLVESLLAPNSKTGYWRKNSRRLLKQLNRLRDFQVLQLRFHDETLLADKLSQAIAHEIDLLRDLHRDISLGKLQGRVFRSIKLSRKSFKAHPKRLARNICSRREKLRAAIAQLINNADQHDYKLLHKLRVQFKSLRYFTEVLVDSEVIDYIDMNDFKRWQDFLGNIQDLSVAIKWLEGQEQAVAIRHNLLDEIEQQRIAFWNEKAGLLALLEKLDQGIADSELACPGHAAGRPA